MKRIFSSILVIIVMLSLVVPAFAEEGSVKDRVKDKIRNSSTAADIREEKQEAREQKMEEKTQNAMEKLQQRAEKEINRRIESLKKLLTKINEIKKLSSTEKATLTSEVQGQIDSLTALLTKIKADTDIETLKTDVKSIVDSYRIYALFLPKIQIMGSADRMLVVADQMSLQAARLETKINEAEGKGNDVSGLKTLLADMKTKIADAKTQANNAITSVEDLKPEDFPGNKTELQSARQMVVTALHDLIDARQDARKIIVELKNFGVLPSVKPTCVPRPICIKAPCELPKEIENVCPEVTSAPTVSPTP